MQAKRNLVGLVLRPAGSAIPLILLLLAAVIHFPACRSSARARQHVERGNQFANQNQVDEARKEFRQAIEIDPDFADAHYRLGILEAPQHPTTATNELSRTVVLDPKNLDARFRLGMLLVSETQYEQAQQQADAIGAADRQSPAAHRLLGQIALHRRQYADAEKELQQAIQLAPRDAAALEDLGLAQLLDAEYGAAEKSFNTATEVRPNDPQTYINLADFYKAQNSTDRAAQILREGMSKNPSAAELPLALASLYNEQGRSADAKHWLDLIETDERTYQYGRRAVAEFYLSHGDATAALPRFRALADRDSHDLPSVRKVAECYVQLRSWQEANDWIDRHDRSDTDLRLLRARSDLGAFRLQEAERELKTLLVDSPEIPAVYYYLAQVYSQQEQRAAAQQAYSNALRAQPGYIPAVLGLGNISLQEGDADRALNYASQVIATSYWLADAHILAGSAYLLKNENDQAQRAFALAAGLNPRSPQAQERIGKVLSLRSNYAEAEKAYEASLSLAPDYAPALNGLSEVLVKQGKVKQASARMDRQIAAQPGAYEIVVAKAEFCVAQKDWPCAERSYKQALIDNPSYVNGYLALAHIYAATNRAGEMIQQYETVRSKFPSYLPAYVLLAQVYAYMGDVDRAQKTLLDALKVDPNFYLAQMNLARLYVDHGGSLADALQLAQKAKASQPDDPNVNDVLGWIYYKQGLYLSAIAPLELAVAKNPQVAAFQFHLGMAYLAMGQSAQAQATLQTAISLGLNPSDARAAQEALQRTHT